jgi:cysteine-rich repeat protein
MSKFFPYLLAGLSLLSGCTIFTEAFQQKCGDGFLQEGEDCDDGDTIADNICDATCHLLAQAVCGDGITVASEECDDGNSDNGDGCDSDCQIEAQTDCGNGTIEAPEACDDGDSIDGDECESNCTLPICGNTIVDIGEECDDGSDINGDGCDNTCRTEIPITCGDGIIQIPEACDDGNNINGDSCENNCTAPVCGNNIVDANEECDQDGGNCLSDCTIRCGVPSLAFARRVVNRESQHCYLAIDNNLNWLAAKTDCIAREGHLVTISNFDENKQVSTINVGQVWMGLTDEAAEGRFVWDDGEPLSFSRFRLHEPNNDIGSEDCVELDAEEWNDQDCIIQTDAYVCEFEAQDCGNGFLEEGEECDDGSNSNGDGCSSSCQAEGAPNCGDSTHAASEECDDGNAFDGDGCDSDCQLEADTFVVCDQAIGGNGNFNTPAPTLASAINVVPPNGTIMILGPNVCLESINSTSNPANKDFILKGSLDTSGGFLSFIDGGSSSIINITADTTLVVQDLQLFTGLPAAAINIFTGGALALLHVDLHNQDSSGGFAISNHGASLLIDRAFIHDNIGGVVNDCDEINCSIIGNLLVTNSIFENNGDVAGLSPNGFGALTTFHGSETLAIGVTFFNNISALGPSSSNCDISSGARLESIVSQDANPDNAIDNNTVVNFSDFFGIALVPQGNFNFNGDPDFISVDGFNFHLGENSEIVDEGNNDPAGLLPNAPFDPSLVFGALLGPGNLFNALFVTDFFGGPRRVGTAIGMGAVEER